MRNRDPRKILIAILSNQKVAAGHLGKLGFGAGVCIVCIFWVLLCPKPQQINTAMESETHRPDSAALQTPFEGCDGSGMSPPSSVCVSCFGEQRPVQLNLPPAQKVSDKR